MLSMVIFYKNLVKMNSDWLGPLFYSSCSTSVMDRTIQYCYDAAEELCYGQDYSVLL